ncbi:MAG: hypothetical protein IJT47_02235, partial [Selenomonadaceae bacterium]|nr:hypothetical protein [Selenomonadaceae bacterium]
ITQQQIDAPINSWKRMYPETRDENVKILDDYLTLCEENNICPIMIRVPVTKEYMASFSKIMLDEFDLYVEQALQKHSSAHFVDGWKWNGVTYTDFCDHEHLNIYGAAKFSEYLNDFIERLDKERG